MSLEWNFCTAAIARVAAPQIGINRAAAIVRAPNGETITLLNRGLARLVAHEIDHRHGHLYTDRMRPSVGPISVEQYRGTGSAWTYHH